MKQRHVSFTFTAQQHVAREHAWWLENRDHPEAFTEELEQALKIVALIPRWKRLQRLISLRRTPRLSQPR